MLREKIARKGGEIARILSAQVCKIVYNMLLGCHILRTLSLS